MQPNHDSTSKARRRESTRSCNVATTAAKNICLQQCTSTRYSMYHDVDQDHLRRGRITASDCSSAFDLTHCVSSTCSPSRALIAACPSLTAANANSVLCAPAWKPVRTIRSSVRNGKHKVEFMMSQQGQYVQQ